MKDSINKLKQRVTQYTGNDSFFNSGLLTLPPFSGDKLELISAGKEFAEFTNPGERLDPTLLYMPPGSLYLPPHCHPGGEVAYVIDGEYFDADMQGRRIASYPAGSMVLYGHFSTHRPLSQSGAKIFYVPLKGVIFPSREVEFAAEIPSNLLDRMKHAMAPQAAIDHARQWMT